MPEIIVSLAASLLAAGAAWVTNGLVIPAIGRRGIAFLTPLVEELAKTLTAISLGAALLWTHVLFGVLEALVEIKRRGTKGLAPGGAALVSHSIFGLLTAGLYGRGGILPALAVTYLAHATWNGAVVACNSHRKSRLD